MATNAARKPADNPDEPVTDTGVVPDSITETPEFQMALAAAAADIQAKVMAAMEARLDGKAAAPSSDDNIERLARAIAASNAEMADQGTFRKRVAPEIIEARSQATKRMHELLVEAGKIPKGDPRRPFYRVRAKGYFGDRLIEPFRRLPGGKIEPTHVYFLSAPNLALEPANDTARAIYAEFIKSISGGDQTIAGMAIPDPSGAKPLWMTSNGAVIATPTMTARAHGMVDEPERIDLSEIPEIGTGNRPGAVEEIVSTDDPRATKIPVLGTIAPPATRGSSSPRLA